MDTPIGRLVREYTTDFRGGVLPSWLTLDLAGSGVGASVAAPTNAGGGLDAVTGYAAGFSRRALIKADGTNLPAVDISATLGPVLIEMDLHMTDGGINPGGTTPNAVGLTVAMFLRDSADSPTCGAGLIRNATSSTVYARGYAAAGAATDKDIVSSWGTVAGTPRRFRHTLRIWPKKRLIQLAEGASIQSQRTFAESEFVLGTVRPEILIQRTTASDAQKRTLHSFTYREYYR
jgi:hypothetical protein